MKRAGIDRELRLGREMWHAKCVPKYLIYKSDFAVHPIIKRKNRN